MPPTVHPARVRVHAGSCVTMRDNAGPVPSHRITARAPHGHAGETAVRTDASVVTAYLEDAAHFPGGHAAGVARPATEADVAALVTGGARILPVGAQSSLTGGATPMGEVVVDMQRFDRIGRITGDEVTVEAGVPIATLQAALARSDRFYPPAPTFDGAFAGGVVSTNAAGAATFKYGTTRDWVRRLTVVLASGEVLDIARGETTAHPDGWFEVETAGAVRRVPAPAYRMPDVVKCSAGYFAEPEMDLIDLFIGAEGTLGVVTGITFAVVMPAPRIAMVWIPLPSEAAAVALAGSLRQAALDCWRTDGVSGVDIAAIEHLDARSLQIVSEDGAARRQGIAWPDGTEVALLAQMELPAGSAAATDPASAYAEIAGALSADAADLPLVRLCRQLAEAGVLDRTEVALPSDTRRQARLLALREAAPEGVNRRVGDAKRRSETGIAKTAADMIVPFDRFEESLALFREAFDSRRLDYAIWGHISDGNVHPNVIPRTIDDVRRGREAILDCGRAIVRLGGSPLAEHGVGRNEVKQALLRQLYGDDGINAMRAVKAALDPDGVLAPGVLFR
ncbi:MAG: FAD-binding oxidoreductase [Acidobacteria bacterium]|nr:FAD-binding oxidoreductase [Acidobacteriota bacterium]